jgi:eukaryotic-like serine/threonine-protein kinase
VTTDLQQPDPSTVSRVATRRVDDPDLPTRPGHEPSTERGGAAAAQDLAFERGTAIGRYLVLETLGRGGMGIVVLAYDPKLGREVALKLVGFGSGARDAEAQARLLREAQALARLSHPNVVAIYDAEPTPHGVCITMEYVEGRNLREWLDDDKRSWREIVEVIIAAARGLAAAHAADLVHRDVKPDNVLVGKDGRVRMTDFGLARASGSRSFSSEAGIVEPPSTIDPDALTRVGTVMGTPPYMAPEQHVGATADARSDQYALCVMLWEALWGKRPFSGASLQLLATAKTLGAPERPSRDVPAWVYAVVARGLMPDPDERWPSIAALIDALGRDPWRVRRWWLGAGLAGAALLSIVAVRQVALTRAEATCDAKVASIDDVWNEAARARVHAGLLASGVGHAETTWEKLVPWIDGYVADWSSLQSRLCRAALVEGSRSENAWTLAEECTAERRDALARLLDLLAEAEEGVAHRAVTAAARLPRLDACNDDAWLSRRARPPDDAEVGARVDALRARMRHAAAIASTGRAGQALPIAEEVLTDAEALGWEPLVADALLQVGLLESKTGAHEDAERRLTEAFALAGRIGHDDVLADAVLELVHVVGHANARSDEGMVWGRVAEVVLDRVDRRGGPRGVVLLLNLGNVHAARGAREEARTAFAEALVLRERELGPDHPDVAMALNNLALAEEALGRHDEALALHERALDLRTRTLGDVHPSVATSLNNLANAHSAAGRNEDARAMYERALPIWEQALGPEHPNIAVVHNNLAIVLEALGRREDAGRLHTRALEIWQTALGPEHPSVATSLNNIALIEVELGRLDEARELHERARTLRERTLGPDHVDVASSLANLGIVLEARGSLDEALELQQRALRIREAALGSDHADVGSSLVNLGSLALVRKRYDEADASFGRALDIFERAFGPEHPHVAHATVGLGRVALARGRPEAAATLHERALDVRMRAQVSPELVAESQFFLAKALEDAGGDRARATTLAEQAAATWRTAPTKAADLAEVEAWLQRHR